MLAAGLVDELAGLRRRFRLDASMPSMRCVGYRQAWRFIDGEGSRDELRARGAAATRQLARRQLTWLRSLEEQTFDAYAPRAAAKIANWLLEQGIAA
jgi:tRNA dimethylallyltransferase